MTGTDVFTDRAIAAPTIRVSIATANRVLDLEAPTSLPVAEVVSTAARMLEAPNPSEIGLSTLTGRTLRHELSLGDQAVIDGDHLVATALGQRNVPRKYDDPSEALARAGSSGPRTDLRIVPCVIAIASSGTLTSIAATAEPSPWLTAVTLTVLLAWCTTFAYCARLLRSPSSTGVAAGAALLSALAFAITIAPAHDTRTAVCVGGSIVALLAFCAWWTASHLSGCFVVSAAALSVVGVASAMAGAIALIRQINPDHVAAVGAITALAALGFTPVLAQRIARYPSPAATVNTPANTPTTAAECDDLAMRATRLHLGLTIGLILVAASSAVALIAPIQDVSAAAQLQAAAVGLILILRSRHALQRILHTSFLLGGGAVTIICILAKALAILPSAAAVAIGFACAILPFAASTLRLTVSMTPPLRRAVELLEMGLIAFSIPLCGHAIGLFEWLRSW